MKATLVLNGKTKDVQAVIGLALEEGVLAGFTTETTDESHEPTPRPRNVSPFAHDDRVAKRWETSTYPQIPRDSTGVVTNVKRNRGGWSVKVSWDNPTIEPPDNGWIAVSQLIATRKA